jgi:F-type H+-transporting ATPase subunit epsilon
MDDMSDHILLEVVTPEHRVLSTHVSELQFRTATRGYYGILPGHTPVLTPLGDGLLHYTQNGEHRWLTLFGGFAEVGPDHVSILARTAEAPETLDPEQVKAERLEAEKLLKEAPTPEDLARAQALLDAAFIRLQALGLTTDH